MARDGHIDVRARGEESGIHAALIVLRLLEDPFADAPLAVVVACAEVRFISALLVAVVEVAPDEELYAAFKGRLVAAEISPFSPVLKPSMFTKAMVAPVKPDRRVASLAKVPSRKLMPGPREASSLARREVWLRVRKRTVKALSWTRDSTMGIP